MNHRRLPWPAAVLGCMVFLQGCGGGGGDSGGMQPPPSAPTTEQRTAAATTTAQSDDNPCAPIRPFYWEIGDENSSLASGSVNSAGNPAVYTATTPMAIASASKWIYGAYVAQLRAGSLTDEDIKFLTFRSGYTSFGRCLPDQSVDECVAYQDNGVYHAATDGLFSYGGGHMEKHASLIGLGPLHNAGLATQVRAMLGNDIALSYSQPQLAGGITTTAANYALFLRRMLGGELTLGSLLGTHAVCTNPTTCPQARNAPVPTTESWNYSLGHWVEVDPVVGDGAFSSAGAFGFYPWIDVTKTWYGIVARQQASGQDPDDNLGEGYRSAQCGRLVRKAWVTAVAQ
ncbi:MAG: hypothetical protein DYH20_03140 [Gammaproteobacteria bacterium PRO9]|nr:hypothetical protein [Gammaproteobacteria bacterium PRO9]